MNSSCCFSGSDASGKGPANVAEKILSAIAQPFHILEYELAITGSIGIALYPNDGEDFESLRKMPDIAMYRAKQEGRHGYRFFMAGHAGARDPAYAIGERATAGARTGPIASALSAADVLA